MTDARMIGTWDFFGSCLNRTVRNQTTLVTQTLLYSRYCLPFVDEEAWLIFPFDVLVRVDARSL